MLKKTTMKLVISPIIAHLVNKSDKAAKNVENVRALLLKTMLYLDDNNYNYICLSTMKKLTNQESCSYSYILRFIFAAVKVLFLCFKFLLDTTLYLLRLGKSNVNNQRYILVLLKNQFTRSRYDYFPNKTCMFN